MSKTCSTQSCPCVQETHDVMQLFLVGKHCDQARIWVQIPTQPWSLAENFGHLFPPQLWCSQGCWKEEFVRYSEKVLFRYYKHLSQQISLLIDASLISTNWLTFHSLRFNSIWIAKWGGIYLTPSGHVYLCKCMSTEVPCNAPIDFLHTSVATMTLVIITSRLDYCYSLCVGLPLGLIEKLQLVQNVAVHSADYVTCMGTLTSSWVPDPLQDAGSNL